MSEVPLYRGAVSEVRVLCSVKSSTPKLQGLLGGFWPKNALAPFSGGGGHRGDSRTRTRVFESLHVPANKDTSLRVAREIGISSPNN